VNTTIENKQIRMWLVLTFGDERQYAGNSGYDDVPDKWYSYDSFVANHRQVAAGHCVILCDRRRALGVARIERIDSVASSRVLQRCPVCKSTGIKKRKARRPEYRCNRGHEFDEAVRENASCTKYTAQFDGTFAAFTEEFGREFLRRGCPRYSDQLAMQEFDFVRMAPEFRTLYPAAAAVLRRMISDSYVSADSAEVNSFAEEGGYAPSESDERERVQREILARRGQLAFRNRLRRRYGDQCMVSGCKVLHVLEAAHIRPYRGDIDNHAENGILLRTDLHTLFDLDLLGIEPESLTVHFHSAIDWGEYRELHGRPLYCSRSRAPSGRALKERWAMFEKRAGFLEK
jgi:putative restriction endonuclease